MRNAIIRKKRLRAQRMLDDFMRMPQRIMVPEMNINVDEASISNRLFSLEQAGLTLDRPYFV